MLIYLFKTTYFDKFSSAVLNGHLSERLFVNWWSHFYWAFNDSLKCFQASFVVILDLGRWKTFIYFLMMISFEFIVIVIIITVAKAQIHFCCIFYHLQLGGGRVESALVGTWMGSEGVRHLLFADLAHAAASLLGPCTFILGSGWAVFGHPGQFEQLLLGWRTWHRAFFKLNWCPRDELRVSSGASKRVISFIHRVQCKRPQLDLIHLIVQVHDTRFISSFHIFQRIVINDDKLRVDLLDKIGRRAFNHAAVATCFERIDVCPAAAINPWALTVAYLTKEVGEGGEPALNARLASTTCVIFNFTVACAFLAHLVRCRLQIYGTECNLIKFGIIWQNEGLGEISLHLSIELWRLTTVLGLRPLLCHRSGHLTIT